MPQKTSTFISFKTNPDQEKAALVLSTLARRNIPVTPLHGGDTCPYSEPAKAAAWIQNFLSKKVKAARTLVIVCSAISLKSEWVYLEYTEALSSVKAIFLLWFDGNDPSEYFFPDPGWLTRRLPSCPVYRIDLRSNPDEAIERLGDILLRLQNAQFMLRFKQSVFFILLLVSFGAAIFLANLFIPGMNSADDAIRAGAVDNLKFFGRFCLVLMWTIAAFFYPTSYTIPQKYRDHPLFFRLVKGTSLSRYGARLLSIFLFFGIHLGAVFLGIVGAILGVITPWARNLIVSRAIARLEKNEERTKSVSTL